MNRNLILLEGLAAYADVGLLVLRALTGTFLIYGVLDNVVSVQRMEEFAIFLQANNFPAPELMARLSVYIQLLCGIALTLGLATRWAGIVIAVHFVIALVMVHWSQELSRLVAGDCAGWHRSAVRLDRCWRHVAGRKARTRQSQQNQLRYDYG